MPVTINRASYAPVLTTIANGESKGNYNAYYGHTSNSSIMFTTMTIAQVLDWQTKYVAQGSPSSAVGKYQIVYSTLQGLVSQLHLDQNQLFDEQLQDTLAITLLERRGSLQYADNKLSQQQFAANIAKEWASLPKAVGANPEQSYYDGDGLNKSRVTTDQIYSALNALQKN